MLGLIRKFAQWPYPLQRPSGLLQLFTDQSSGDDIGAVVSNGQIETIKTNVAKYLRRSFRYTNQESGEILVKFKARVSNSGLNSQIRVGLVSQPYEAGSIAIQYDAPHVGIYISPLAIYLNNVGSTKQTHIPYEAGTEIEVQLEYNFDQNITVLTVNGQSMRMEGEIPLPQTQLQHLGIRTYADVEIKELRVYLRRASLVPMGYPWLQNLFWDNTSYEEVNGITNALASGNYIQDNKLIGSQSTAQALAQPFTPGPDEDFTIQLRFHVGDISNLRDILCVALSTIAATSWRITMLVGGKIEFAFVVAGASVETKIETTTAIKTNTEYQIAIVRRTGVISILLDGQVEASTFSQAGFNRVNSSVSTKRSNVAGIFGARWDLRIAKKALSASELAKKPENFLRPFYSDLEIPFINSQIVVRDAEARNEVGSTIQGTYTLGAGSIYQAINTSDGQRLQWDAPAFGAGDFTVEVEFLRNSLGSAEAQLIGDWYITGTSQYNIQYFRGWQLICSNSVIWFYPSPNYASDPRAIVASGLSISDGLWHRIIVERVQGVIRIYLNSAKVAEVADAKPIVRTNSGKLNVQNFNLNNKSWVAASTLQLRSIRVADKAIYGGDLTKVENFYPRIPGDYSARCTGISAQVLVPDNTVIPSTQHNITGISAQILVKV